MRNKLKSVLALPLFRFAALSLLACSPLAFGASAGVSVKRARPRDVPALYVTVGPTSVAFPSRPVGTPGYAVTVMLSNFNYLAVAVSSIAVSGDFSETNTCGSSVAGESSCTISLTFLPRASGVRTGTLAITDSGNGSPQTVALSGVAEPPGMGFTATTATVTAQAGALPTLSATVTGTYAAGAPAGLVTFLDTTNSNAVLGTALLGTGTIGQALVNGPSSATGGEQVSVVTADFNRDGKADLAVLNNAGQGCYSSVEPSISILLGNGDGTFTAAASPSGAQFCADNLVVADFNGDGKPDIAVAANGTSFALLLGNGDGTFVTQNIPVDGASYANIATGDFNGDGRPDLAFLNLSTDAETILLGNGDGTFAVSSANPPAAPNAELEMVGDFNGDGWLDVATMGEQPAADGSAFDDIVINLSLGNGDGTFQLPTTTDVGNSLLPAAAFQNIGVGDFNGDGKADLAIEGAIVNGPSTSSDGVLVLLAQGSGSFAAASPVPIKPSPRCTQDQQCNQSSNSGSIAVADFNGDGSVDLALLTDDVVQVLLNNGKGTFTAAATVDSGAETDPDYLALTVGDFNGDGVPDLASTDSGANTVTLSLGERTETALAMLPGVAIVGTGTHYLEAVYAGSSTFVPSTSVPIIFRASPPPMAALTPGSLAFAGQTIGSTSGAQTVTLSNAGTTPLTVTSIVTTGAFAQTSTCGKSVAAAGSCKISISFAPLAAGPSTGTVTITDNAGNSPQSVALTGQGVAVPLAVLTPATLTFPPQTVGSTGSAQMVTLSNPGSAPLNVTSIVASADFAETANCGPTVEPGSSCAIAVTFTPTAGGAITGTLTAHSNAAGSSPLTTLTGQGALVSVSSSTPALSISSAGGAATAMVQVAPAGGFTGPVDLTCAIKYLGQGTATDPPTCSLTPSRIQVTGNAPVATTLSISTTAASASSRMNGLFNTAGTALAGLLCLGLLPLRRLRAQAFVTLSILIATALSGCGGNSGGGTTVTQSNPGTTAGSYQVVITVTSAAPASSISLPLSLQ